MSDAPRKIIHIDMDAFYASVAQRDYPELAGKPVIVGGRPDSRGVVAAASYEARRFGIRSAMPASRAYRLCPQAVFIKPDFARYRDVSRQIHAIFHQFTALIEPLSLDEAYLDVSESTAYHGSATWLAEAIRGQIQAQTGLTASAGVSFNKFLAKLASDENKPNGLCVITPAQAEAFIAPMDVGRFHGIGPKTREKMQQLGIYTGHDLRQVERTVLEAHFGKAGGFYYHIARGQDPRPVRADRIRKSIGHEQTFAEDLTDPADMRAALAQLAEKVATKLQQKNQAGQTVTLKVRFADFSIRTRSTQARPAIMQAGALLDHAQRLLEKTPATEKPVRLLGIAVSHLTSVDDARRQASLPLPGLSFPHQ